MNLRPMVQLKSCPKRLTYKWILCPTITRLSGVLLMYRIMSGFLITLAFLLFSGCVSESNESNINLTSEARKINKSEVGENQIIVHHGYDSMDRGNKEFTAEIVVDTKHYSNNPINRGDIVYYRVPNEFKERMGEYSISRVVGLPGEKIKITSGRVYVDGKPLDTFYGEARRLGSNVNELKEALSNAGLKENAKNNIETMVEYFGSINMDEIEVPEDELFIIGDDWFRSNDSRSFGPISLQDIEGKVLGELSN